MALKNFPIDRLPGDVKRKAAAAIAKADTAASLLAADVEQLLELNARSPLDSDKDADQVAADEQAKQRVHDMKEFEGLYPGRWRPKKPKK